MNAPSQAGYDAVLLVSFGGPEKREDVIPFLENVVRGRNVPRERLLEAAEHYYRFDGKSPLNDQNRQLIAALAEELHEHGPRLPIYWGNRNWHPLLADTVREMAVDGVGRALAFVTSAYSSYSGCRQYLDNIAAARAEAGATAPDIDKIRAFYNHPGFIEPMIEATQMALDLAPNGKREAVDLVFTAHSIPVSMANTCRYVEQLEEASSLVAGGLGWTDWKLVYQSRSGPPSQPWLEPDICDHLREVATLARKRDVVVVPIGFTSDHMEVLYDLDTEAHAVAVELGLNMVRAATVGTHPRFVRMIRELITERMVENPTRLAVGNLGPRQDFCPADCCPPPQRPTERAAQPTPRAS